MDLLLINFIICGEYFKCIFFISLKLFYDRKLIIFNSCKNDFVVLCDIGGLRVFLFCIGLYGGIVVGKFNMFDVVMKYLLCNNGYLCIDEYIVMLNEIDKYMLIYKIYVIGVFLDDVGNLKV